MLRPSIPRLLAIAAVSFVSGHQPPTPLIAVGFLAFLTERLLLRRINYDPEATIVATIGLLFVIQQLALSLLGADAKPVAAPFT